MVLVLYIHIFVAQRNSPLFVLKQKQVLSLQHINRRKHRRRTTVRFIPFKDGHRLDSHHIDLTSLDYLIFLFFF